MKKSRTYYAWGVRRKNERFCVDGLTLWNDHSKGVIHLESNEKWVRVKVARCKKRGD